MDDSIELEPNSAAIEADRQKLESALFPQTDPDNPLGFVFPWTDLSPDKQLTLAEEVIKLYEEGEELTFASGVSFGLLFDDLIKDHERQATLVSVTPLPHRETAIQERKEFEALMARKQKLNFPELPETVNE